MGKPANFSVVATTELFVVIRDEGPWNVHFTVTNDAEGVVSRLADVLKGRRLLYYDSVGDLDEIAVRDGKFLCFRSARHLEGTNFLADA
jgi:hypothetical protein